MNDDRQERESVWSVGRNWLPWCLGLIFALTIAWTWFVARVIGHRGEHENVAEIAIVVDGETASAVPLIVVYAMFLLTSLDLVGGGVMVTYRYLERKILKPQQDKFRAEALAKGRAEGTEQMQRAWEDWNHRREEAEANGETFAESPAGR